MTGEERNLFTMIQNSIETIGAKMDEVASESKQTNNKLIRLETHHEDCIQRCNEMYLDLNSRDETNPGLKMQVQELKGWSKRWHKGMWAIVLAATGIVGPITTVLVQHFTSKTAHTETKIEAKVEDHSKAVK